MRTSLVVAESCEWSTVDTFTSTCAGPHTSGHSRRRCPESWCTCRCSDGGETLWSTRSSPFVSATAECARTQLCGGVPRHRACRREGGQTLLHTNPQTRVVQREGLRRVQHAVEHGTVYTWFIIIPLCIIQLQRWGAIPTPLTLPRPLSRPNPPRPPRPPPAAPSRCEG
jgi:hypothetical protein